MLIYVAATCLSLILIVIFVLLSNLKTAIVSNEDDIIKNRDRQKIYLDQVMLVNQTNSDRNKSNIHALFEIVYQKEMKKLWKVRDTK